MLKQTHVHVGLGRCVEELGQNYENPWNRSSCFASRNYRLEKLEKIDPEPVM